MAHYLTFEFKNELLAVRCHACLTVIPCLPLSHLILKCALDTFSPLCLRLVVSVHSLSFNIAHTFQAFSSLRDGNNHASTENLDLVLKFLYQGSDTGSKLYNEKYLSCLLAALTHLAVHQRTSEKDAEVERQLVRVLSYTTRVVSSHRGLVGSLCLRCLCALEIARHKAPSSTNYQAYAAPHHPAAVRVAALQCVVRLYLRAGATHPLPASTTTTNYAEGMANQRRHDQKQWLKAFLWVLGQLGCAPSGSSMVIPLPAPLRHLVWTELVRVCVFDDLSGGVAEHVERGIASSGAPCRDLADDIADDEGEEGAQGDGGMATAASPRVASSRRVGKKIRPTDLYRFDTRAHSLRHLRARTPEFQSLVKHLWRQLSEGTGLCPKARFSLYRILKALGNPLDSAASAPTNNPEPLRTWQLEADTVVDPTSRYMNENKIMKLLQLEELPPPTLPEAWPYMPVHRILRLHEGNYRMAEPETLRQNIGKDVMELVSTGRVQINLFSKPKPVDP